MTSIATFHPFSFFATLTARISNQTRTGSGPLPRWVDDPQLSRQLLKDTGLSYEDLTGQTRYDDKLPFFMQPGRWQR